VAQIVAAFCSCVTAVAAVVAVFSFLHSLKAERIKAAEDSVARLYPLDSEAQRLLVQHPNVRLCFRQDNDGKKYEKLSDEEKARFKSASAVLSNVFEYYVLIRDNIGGHPKSNEIIASWDEYLKTVCEESYGYRSYIWAKREIWTQGFRDAFDKYAGNRPYEKQK
jgi:hypothetical protein